jgi:hypothetical protein
MSVKKLRKPLAAIWKSHLQKTIDIPYQVIWADSENVRSTDESALSKTTPRTFANPGAARYFSPRPGIKLSFTWYFSGIAFPCYFC